MRNRRRATAAAPGGLRSAAACCYFERAAFAFGPDTSRSCGRSVAIFADRPGVEITPHSRVFHGASCTRR
jgi:hypothetical protein